MFKKFQYSNVSDEAFTAMSDNEKLKVAITTIVVPAVAVVACVGFVSGAVQAYFETKREKNKSN